MVSFRSEIKLKPRPDLPPLVGVSLKLSNEHPEPFHIEVLRPRLRLTVAFCRRQKDNSCMKIIPLDYPLKRFVFSSLLDTGVNVPCNLNCSCSLASISPVCGEDNLAYFSPCHAGCKSILNEEVLKHGYANL